MSPLSLAVLQPVFWSLCHVHREFHLTAVIGSSSKLVSLSNWSLTEWQLVTDRKSLFLLTGIPCSLEWVRFWLLQPVVYCVSHQCTAVTVKQGSDVESNSVTAQVRESLKEAIDTIIPRILSEQDVVRLRLAFRLARDKTGMVGIKYTCERTWRFQFVQELSVLIYDISTILTHLISFHLSYHHYNIDTFPPSYSSWYPMDFHDIYDHHDHIKPPSSSSSSYLTAGAPNQLGIAPGTVTSIHFPSSML